MGTFLQDLRFAWRMLRRTPALPLAAIGTLAIGIGATIGLVAAYFAGRIVTSQLHEVRIGARRSRVKVQWRASSIVFRSGAGLVHNRSRVSRHENLHALPGFRHRHLVPEEIEPIPARSGQGPFFARPACRDGLHRHID